MGLAEENVDLAFAHSRHEAACRLADPGEYVGDGYLAIVAAADGFDPSRASFRTWAQHRIRWSFIERRRTESRRSARHVSATQPLFAREDGHASLDSADFVAWCASLFTGRRREIVLGLARGLKRADLARWLGISEATLFAELRLHIRPMLRRALA